MLVVEEEVVLFEDEVLKHCRGGRGVWGGSVESAWIAASIPSLFGMLV